MLKIEWENAASKLSFQNALIAWNNLRNLDDLAFVESRIHAGV